jgi:preprotein translocase subunit SecF
MFIIRNRKIFYSITGVLLALAVYFIWHDGLTFGIDFTGGSVVQVRFEEGRPDQNRVIETVSGIVADSVSVRPVGDTEYSIRSQFIGEEEKSKILEALAFGGEYSPIEERFSAIGPSVGNELKRKAIVAIVIVIIAIILFIAFAFRKVSNPISSWVYGGVAIVTLCHDILIPFGLFAILDIFMGAEVDILFVTALLAILGYSVNDTIVVFDRIRENLKDETDEPFEEIVGKSLSQTFTRSVNTSFTTLIALVFLLVLAGDAVFFFALVLAVGILAGTYSSIFLASPLLVTVAKWLKKA